MKYRKRPVIIEAEQWLGSAESWENIMAMGDIKWKPGEMGTKTFIIETLEGDHVARDGDFIIRGVAGEFYPCKPEIFRKTYDRVCESKNKGGFDIPGHNTNNGNSKKRQIFDIPGRN